MYVCMHVCIYIYIYVYAYIYIYACIHIVTLNMFNMASTSVIPVSVNNNSFYVSLGHATQRKKLRFSPRFDVFKADCPTDLLIRRSAFSQTPVGTACGEAVS